MPIHDWTRVDAGIYHDFHQEWIKEIKRDLNANRLPSDYYALSEQLAGGLGPDVLALSMPDGAEDESPMGDGKPGTTTLSLAEPKVYQRVQGAVEQYASKASSAVIHHVSNHRVIAIIEVLSPGNKNSKHGLNSFLRKVDELLRAGVHLLILDLFPPGPRDPQGIHKAIWDEITDNDFELPIDMPLTLVSYRADRSPEAFIEPTAVGSTLTAMPLFLSLSEYITVPLELSYHSAWEAVPRYWREVVEGTRQH